MIEYRYHRRLQEFDGLMSEYHNHPIVNHFAKMYVRCEIVTKEEALCQMVKALCADWSEINRRELGSGNDGIPAQMSQNPIAQVAPKLQKPDANLDNAAGSKPAASTISNPSKHQQ